MSQTFSITEASTVNLSSIKVVLFINNKAWVWLLKSTEPSYGFFLK